MQNTAPRKNSHKGFILHNVLNEKLKNDEANKTVELRSKASNQNKILTDEKDRTDRELNLAHFKILLDIFKSAACGNKTLDFDAFNESFKTALGFKSDDNNERMKVMFEMIDTNSDNRIDWDDFSEYMLLRAEGKKKMKETDETQLFSTESPNGLEISCPHNDTIVRIEYSEKTKRFISISKNSTVCYWSESFKLQRVYKNVGISEDAIKDEHLTVAKILARRWVLDFTMMENVYSVSIATDDHEINIYDLTTMERIFCLNLKDTCAISLDYWSKSSVSDMVPFSRLFYGTDSGCVYIYEFPDKLFADRGPRKKDSYPELNMQQIHTKSAKVYGTLTRKKIHEGWVLKVKYYECIKGLISCSQGSKDSLAVTTLDQKGKWFSRTVSVQKGVNSFALSSSPMILATGGTDRQIRLWNPRRISQPIALLYGHSSPIIDLQINTISGQIISLCTENVIKVWDIRNQQCIQTIVDTGEHYHGNDINSLYFHVKQGGKLITANNNLKIYKLKEKISITDEVKSHNLPIRNLLYNNKFNLVVSGCNEGNVHIWDPSTGRKTFRMTNLHGMSEITAMSFDSSRRRLFTGGRNGSVRVWNFNNGQLLQELDKGDDSEVTDIQYVDLIDIQYILVTGWNKKVIIYQDNPNTFNLLPSGILPLKTGERFWHTEDILCVVFCHPNKIATAGYDGKIIISNLYSSHILFVMELEAYDRPAFEDRSIDKLLVLESRVNDKNASALISCGSDGHICFWNIHLGKLDLRVDGTNGRSGAIYCMATDTDNNFLITGDSKGWISIWDISDLCINEHFQKRDVIKMNLVNEFRAHSSGITNISISLKSSSGSAGSDVIFTSSDCTVRMFTRKGEHIGIFGQFNQWDILDTTSYWHPNLFADVKNILENENEQKVAQNEKKDGEILSPPGDNLKEQISLKSNFVNSSKSTFGGNKSQEIGNDLERPGTSDLLNPIINTWYSNTIYAKEQHLKKNQIKNSKKMYPSNSLKGNTMRFYQYLNSYDLHAVEPLPAIFKGRSTKDEY